MNENMNRYIPHAMLSFEVQVSEHCNLNCRNCMHYSPLADPEFLNIEEYERDLQRLSELFDGEVEWIRLMGGEPLLNPNINKIMNLTRLHFPYGRIMIVTNGILLNDQPGEFFEECKKNNVEIQVTKYPIDVDYETIKTLVSSKGIEFGLYGDGENRRPIMWRFPIDPNGAFSPEINFYRCRGANGCITLRKGRLFTCAPAAHAHLLREYFNINISCSDRNSVDIYKIDSADAILDRLAKPIPFCRYCDFENIDDYEDDWSVSNKNIYEWVQFTFSKSDIDYLKKKGKVYVFGAGKWGKKTINQLIENDVIVDSVLVTNPTDNPKSIFGIEVKAYTDIMFDKEDVCLIALSGEVKKDIQHVLRERGLKNVIPILREP